MASEPSRVERSRLLLAAAVLLLLGLGLKYAFPRRAAAEPDRPGPQDPGKDPRNKDLMRLFGSHVC